MAMAAIRYGFWHFLADIDPIIRLLAPFILIFISLFIALLATLVLVYLLCRGILQSLRVPQRKGYVLNVIKKALEHTTWGFIHPYSVLRVLAEDSRAVFKS